MLSYIGNVVKSAAGIPTFEQLKATLTTFNQATEVANTTFSEQYSEIEGLVAADAFSTEAEREDAICALDNIKALKSIEEAAELLEQIASNPSPDLIKTSFETLEKLPHLLARPVVINGDLSYLTAKNYLACLENFKKINLSELPNEPALWTKAAGISASNIETLNTIKTIQNASLQPLEHQINAYTQARRAGTFQPLFSTTTATSVKEKIEAHNVVAAETLFRHPNDILITGISSVQAISLNSKEEELFKEKERLEEEQQELEKQLAESSEEFEEAREAYFRLTARLCRQQDIITDTHLKINDSSSLKILEEEALEIQQEKGELGTKIQTIESTILEIKQALDNTKRALELNEEALRLEVLSNPPPALLKEESIDTERISDNFQRKVSTNENLIDTKNQELKEKLLAFLKAEQLYATGTTWKKIANAFQGKDRAKTIKQLITEISAPNFQVTHEFINDMNSRLGVSKNPKKNQEEPTHIQQRFENLKDSIHTELSQMQSLSIPQTKEETTNNNSEQFHQQENSI